MEGRKEPCGFEEWAVRVIQGMYSNARSHVRVNGQNREEVFIRALSRRLGSLPHESLALVCCGIFATPMTLCSLRTSRRSVSPSVTHGRPAWKVKGPASTRGSSWSLVLVMMSSRNLASTPVMPAVKVLAITPYSARSECGGPTRNAEASLSYSGPNQTMSAPDVKEKPAPSNSDWSVCRRH